MAKLTEQPDHTTEPTTDLAKLRAKVHKLAEKTQVKKDELNKKRGEKETAGRKAKEKAEEDKYRENLFADGAQFAKFILKPTTHYHEYNIVIPKFNEYDRFAMSEHGCVTVVVNGEAGGYVGRSHTVHNIEEYIDFLKGAFKELQDVFRLDRNCGYTPQIITEQISPFAADIHAHMEGFIQTILGSNPSTDILLGAVKVAMIAGSDTFCGFSGRQAVLERLQTAVIGKIERELSTDAALDEAGIAEIEKILHEVQEAVGQQVK